MGRRASRRSAPIAMNGCARPPRPKAVAYAEDVRNAIQRATTLSQIDIAGDVAVAHKKFDGSIRKHRRHCRCAPLANAILLPSDRRCLETDGLHRLHALRLDHDAFSSNRAEGMVIIFNEMEHDVPQEPVPTSWHHALGPVFHLIEGRNVPTHPQAGSAQDRQCGGHGSTGPRLVDGAGTLPPQGPMRGTCGAAWRGSRPLSLGSSMISKAVAVGMKPQPTIRSESRPEWPEAASVQPDMRSGADLQARARAAAITRRPIFRHVASDGQPEPRNLDVSPLLGLRTATIPTDRRSKPTK